MTNWHVACNENNFFEEHPKNPQPPEKIVIRVPIANKNGKIRIISWQTKAIKTYENTKAKWILNEKYHFDYQKPLGDVVAFDIGDLPESPVYAFTYSSLKPSLSIAIGQRLFIVGYPAGLSASSILPIPFVKTVFASTSPKLGTQSISLGKKKSFRIDDGFFTDGNLSSGMSGAPVIDENGKLVGIYSGRLNPTDTHIGIVWGKDHILSSCGVLTE